MKQGTRYGVSQLYPVYTIE